MSTGVSRGPARESDFGNKAAWSYSSYTGTYEALAKCGPSESRCK